MVQRWLESERGGLVDEQTLCACIATSLLRLGREEAAAGSRVILQSTDQCDGAPLGSARVRSAACEAAAPLAEVLASAGGLRGPAGPAASAGSARGWEGWARLEAWPGAAAAWLAGGCRGREALQTLGCAAAARRVRADAAGSMEDSWGRLAD